MTKIIWARAPRIAIMAGVVVLFALLPFYLENYWLRIWTSVLMYVIVTQGLNIIVGFAGYHAFGNSAFFGVGAYATAVFLASGFAFPVGLVASLLISAILAAIIGMPLLRLRGHYFAIATVALNIALAELVINLDSITGGAQGIAMPLIRKSPEELYREIYLMMLGGAVLATLIIYWLSVSKFGYALRASKDSDSGAKAMGINTARIRVLAWMISAAVTGYAGAVWAYWMNFIEVTSAFDINISIKGYVMLLVGGMGSIVGPVIGAGLFETSATLVWSKFGAVHNMFLGILVCIAVLFVPRGFNEYVRNLRRKLKTLRADRANDVRNVDEDITS